MADTKCAKSVIPDMKLCFFVNAFILKVVRFKFYNLRVSGVVEPALSEFSVHNTLASKFASNLPTKKG